MKMPSTQVCTEIWRTKLENDFCTMTVATLFKASGVSLVVGGEDGMVRIHSFTSSTPPTALPQTTLETKSGPIQCLVAHDVTRFYHNDLIVADSCGMLTVFCNQQILSRQSLSADSLICVTVLEDNAGSPVIVASNESGVITGLQPTGLLWRIDLNTLSTKNPSVCVKVTCLLCAHMTDTSGNTRQYILAADNARRIHLICGGIVVSSLTAPANILAMCQGRFVSSSKLQLTSPSTPSTSLTSPQACDSQQVALASATGAVYIMHNLQITLDDYITSPRPITSLCSVPQTHLTSATSVTSDLLLCAGHFSSLLAYREGKMVSEFPTSDWVSNIVTADIDGDGKTEVLIGCMDRTVMALKL